MTANVFRSRPAMLLFASLSAILLYLAVYRPAPPEYISKLSPVKYMYTAVQKHHTGPAADPLEVLSLLYEDERISLLSEYDEAATEALVRTAPGGLSPDFNSYITRLEKFVDTYFNHSAVHPILTNTLTRMVNAQTPLEEREFNKYVFAFDKAGVHGVPDEFKWWARRLFPEGWEIDVAGDKLMEEWFAEGSKANPDVIKDEHDFAQSGQAKWEKMWNGLGRPVLKSDLLRYLMLLTKGGLYTDSDTSILSDPNLWGTHAKDYTPHGLSALQRAMRHLDESHPSSKHRMPAMITEEQMEEAERLAQAAEGNQVDTPATEIDGPREELIPLHQLDFASTKMQEIKRGINNPRVSLVIAVEYDVHHPRQDPRVAYTRDLQIVQWTMLAKPFHPVYMDVLETATTQIMDRRAKGDSKESWETVLDGTGPGPFTDAVLRYILVQYGVTPNELMGMEGGALIGDILLLPLHAFGSYLGGEEDWNAEDPSTRCTAHGFRGRWKGDMNSQRRRSRMLR